MLVYQIFRYFQFHLVEPIICHEFFDLFLSWFLSKCFSSSKCENEGPASSSSPYLWHSSKGKPPGTACLKIVN
ncbi:hypothetical protein Mgra_00002802 [Meloidogyne graminicola]|uniref:Uncharacterized protein n=1 Tax=Meloidogyne graminicola TaxID=189291 RepID=A0A8S9ZXH3_9BILA|nr:hypothetical protein Mgra_00002802 [Meloidogyne graminicola]